MNRFFIKRYLDEDVSVVVAKILQSRGFQAVTTREAGNLGGSDSGQLSYAADHGMAILTHNRVHFERLARQYFDAGQEHAGIVIAVRRLPSELANRLLIGLDQFTADEMQNQLLYI
ncbi:MAG: DUF5615 family PIN-like protein [Acidobacteriota bacterium]